MTYGMVRFTSDRQLSMHVTGIGSTSIASFLYLYHISSIIYLKKMCQSIIPIRRLFVNSSSILSSISSHQFFVKLNLSRTTIRSWPKWATVVPNRSAFKRTSARSSGGGEGERRLCTPGRGVGGLQIFLPFLLGRDVLTTEDGLSLSPNGVAAAKTLEPCVGVGHIEADLEENTPQPPTWRTKCRWISCRKNTGYHVTDPKIRTQGAERGRSWIATKHSDGSLKTSNAQCTVERDIELYPGQGPHGEIKPLLPAFLYYDAIPREEYKVLVTEL
jgi:hypothetical protein